MKDMPVILEICETKPDYRKTAGMLLTDCRAFYENPENEEAFRAWKEGKTRFFNFAQDDKNGKKKAV